MCQCNNEQKHLMWFRSDTTSKRYQIRASFVLTSLHYTMRDLFMRETPVFLFYIQSPAWLHSHCSPTVFLNVHLSLSGSTTQGLSASLWTSVYFLLHQSSWLQTPPPHHYGHQTHPLPSTPLADQPSPPLSRVSPPNTSCEPLMLILQSTSPCHVDGQNSTALFLRLSLYFAVCTGLLIQRHFIIYHICKLILATCPDFWLFKR